MMVVFEADTIEKAYEKACEYFNVPFSSLETVIVQHPSTSVLGMFDKPAIIVARINTPVASQTQNDSLDDTSDHDDAHTETSDDTPTIKEPATMTIDEPLDDTQIAQQIEEELKVLLIEKSCFDVDVVEVDVADNTALIFIDGEDAPLLIGKEGYRYNALSYMLFNWIHGKYGLYIKLEIAQFLTMQQEMIRNLLFPLIEEIRQEGKGRTKVLDGILVQIALEQLREAFPDKYVAIKTDRNGGRYVLVNEFNTK